MSNPEPLSVDGKAYVRGPPKRPGRSTALTPEVHAKVVHAVRIGMYIEQAAALVGVNRATVYAWLKRGSQEKSGPYRDFAAAVTRALGESESLMPSRLHKLAQDGSFQATSWFLERRFRHWSRTHHVEIKGKVETNGITVELIRAAAAMAEEKTKASARSAIQAPAAKPGSFTTPA